MCSPKCWGWAQIQSEGSGFSTIALYTHFGTISCIWPPYTMRYIYGSIYLHKIGWCTDRGCTPTRTCFHGNRSTQTASSTSPSYIFFATNLHVKLLYNDRVSAYPFDFSMISTQSEFHEASTSICVRIVFISRDNSWWFNPPPCINYLRAS